MNFHFSPVQGVLVLISLFFLGNRIVKYIRKERTQTVFKLLLTIIIWGGILFTSLFPELVHTVSRNLGLGENLNTLIFFGFVVVFVILFKLLSSFESLERQLTELVRKEALKEIFKKN